LLQNYSKGLKSINRPQGAVGVGHRWSV